MDAFVRGKFLRVGVAYIHARRNAHDLYGSGAASDRFDGKPQSDSRCRSDEVDDDCDYGTCDFGFVIADLGGRAGRYYDADQWNRQ